MKKGKLYVDRLNRHSRIKLPHWAYLIRWRLARWITPPYLVTYVVLPYEENTISTPVADGETGMPLFNVEVIYFRRPQESHPEAQRGVSSPLPQ